MARKVLKATEGTILTNGVDFGRVVYLAEGEDEKAWYEITEEEYKRMLDEEGNNVLY